MPLAPSLINGQKLALQGHFFGLPMALEETSIPRVPLLLRQGAQKNLRLQPQFSELAA